MPVTSQELLKSGGFRSLVRRKWIVSILLTTLLFVLYYGFILLIAYDKPLLAKKIGLATTLGIPLGVAVIVLAWVLTALYVAWANARYDADVRTLRDQLKP